METITLNDGTVVTGHCFDDGQNLYVYLDGMSVVEGVILFGSEEKTRVITAHNHGNEHVYEGYTQVYSASHEYGNCNLVMRKPEA